MDWVELIDVVVTLHGTGMSIPMALEQHAYFGSGSSQLIAQEWLAQRQVSGDPVAAMRALAARARTDADRFARETLTICLEYPNADHRDVLTTAIDQLCSERHRAPRGRVLVGLALVGPTAIEILRLVMTGLEV